MAISKINAALRFEERVPAAAQREASSETSWVPNTDVYVAEGGLVIKVELAGICREELELMAEGHQLKISGFRPDGCRAPKCRFQLMEINYGAFETVIDVPPEYDLSQARAIYQNGFLRVDVPEFIRPPKKSHSVPISTG
jgi:HSP20 family protein